MDNIKISRDKKNPTWVWVSDSIKNPSNDSFEGNDFGYR